MNFGEMNWRPRLRQFGWAPKGEEWRCWNPGLHTKPGEQWSEEVTLSLLERWHMAIGYGYGRQLAELMKDCDVYSVMHLEDFFRFVLHLPRPLAEILDEIKIPRRQTKSRFTPMFGPPPEFHGPLEQSGLVPHGTSMGNNKELVVQPMMVNIPHLPVFKIADPTYWIDTLEKLVKSYPLEIGQEGNNKL